jgi:hypothetical protein
MLKLKHDERSLAVLSNAVVLTSSDEFLALLRAELKRYPIL